MNTVKKIFLLNIVILIAVSTHAQDLHFSQFFNSPLTTNPANTGFIPDADYRIGINYRNQWSTIMSSPYKTMSAWGDAQLFRDKLENGWVGIGGVILSDQAGSGSLKSNKFYASAAYHQMLGNSSLLSAGFNLGYVSKRIDQTNLKFPDQFDGKFFDGTRPTDVQFTNLNIDYYDMQVGVNYAYFPQENVYINAGYSVHHVNKPTESFFGDNTKAALMTRGLVEITRLGVAMGAEPLTFSGLSGLGDLIVTCMSRHSRNRWVGEQIGRGKTLEEILRETPKVAEGVPTTVSALALSKKYEVEMPIVSKVHEVLFENKNPREAIQELMLRQSKPELWD